MPTIKAPFNFVPLNKNVYFPEWANQITQDIPFSDGLSGTIDVNIKAESPILVSDGVQERGQTHYFCHTPGGSMSDWRYFIPGTSVKGAIRNVLEILSFGKMSFTQNRSFTIRDLYRGKKNDDDDEIKTDGDFYLEKINVETIHCGWMTKTPNGCFIDDCGKPWRISVERIDEMFERSNISLGLKDFVLDTGKFSNSEENKGNRFAKKKYDMLKESSGTTSDRELMDLLTSTFVNDTDTDIAKGGRVFKCYGETGDLGTIVFTGQPGARKKKGGKWEGKFFEFIFPQKIQREQILVPDGVYRTFETIHKDSPDYEEFRRKQLNEGKRIPVFFTYNSNNSEEIDSIGISYMYRYPAFNSVYNGITPLELLDSEKHDLPECIFGYTGRNDSLKGRVLFSNAFLIGDPVTLEKRYALSSPHPSFYPLYLGNGQSWNSQNIRIAGRKRYPVRSALYGNKGTSNMESPKRPLNTGSQFKCEIRFFNLKPIELGALLSSLDFCGHNECFHSIGQGKPLGYGKVKISVEKVSFSYGSIDISSAKDSFIDAMNEESKSWPVKWEDSDQLKELFAMAKGIPDNRDEEFKYMQMSIKTEDGEKRNEFKDALKAYKDDGAQLGRFTQILNDSVPTSSLHEMASLKDDRYDIESYLICKEKVSEIVNSGNVPGDIMPEELIWMEDILINTKDVVGDDIDTLLNSYSGLIEPQKAELQEKKIKEEEERTARLNQEKEEEILRQAHEKEIALKQKEEERKAKNNAKSEWKRMQQENNINSSKTEESDSTIIQPLTFVKQLESAPSIGQLAKMINNHFENEKKSVLSDEELEALAKGILNVIASLRAKGMSKSELKQKGAWQANGNIWKKVADLVGIEVFTSVFPKFTNNE